MTLDFNENLESLILEITAFQTMNDSQVKSVKMDLTKDNIDYLQHIGTYLSDIVFEELVRELYNCDTDKDYNDTLNYFTENEIREILLTLDNKFDNLSWNKR